jgi:WD40 repeat protein
MRILKGATGRVESLVFSPDGGSLAVPRSGVVQVWDIASPATPVTIPVYGIAGVGFLPGSRKMILAGRQLLLHDRDRNVSTPISSGISSWVRTFDLHPDGDELLIEYASAFCFLRMGDEPTFVWAVGAASSPGCSLFFLSRSRFARIVLAWNGGGVVQVYAIHDVATGTVVSSVTTTEAEDDYRQHVISADRRLMAARRGTRVAVLPCDDFSNRVAVIRNDSRKEFTGLAFHPSGRFLAATSNDATVKLYDTTRWQMAHAFDWGIGRLRSIAFSPDGSLAAAGGDKGQIIVWDFDL